MRHVLLLSHFPEAHPRELPGEEEQPLLPKAQHVFPLINSCPLTNLGMSAACLAQLFGMSCRMEVGKGHKCQQEPTQILPMCAHSALPCWRRCAGGRNFIGMQESQNDPGWKGPRSSSSTPCRGQSHLPLQALSNLALHPSRDGAPQLFWAVSPWRGGIHERGGHSAVCHSLLGLGENPPVGMEGESGIASTACAGHWGQSRALSPPLPCLRKVWLFLEEKWGREKQWLIHPLLGTLIPAGWKALLEPPWFLLLPFAARGVRSVPCAVPSRGDALASQHTELWRNSRERTPEELDHPAGPGCGKWDVHSGHCG